MKKKKKKTKKSGTVGQRTLSQQWATAQVQSVTGKSVVMDREAAAAANQTKKNKITAEWDEEGWRSSAAADANVELWTSWQHCLSQCNLSVTHALHRSVSSAAVLSYEHHHCHCCCTHRSCFEHSMEFQFFTFILNFPRQWSWWLKWQQQTDKQTDTATGHLAAEAERAVEQTCSTGRRRQRQLAWL